VFNGWKRIMHLRGISSAGCLGSILGGLAIAFVLTGLGAARAQGTADEQDACRPDVFRLCITSIPNVERIVACLKANGPRLSPACHKVMFARPEASPSLTVPKKKQ
jgi:hypothetical protein